MNRKEFHSLLSHVNNTWSPPEIPLVSQESVQTLKECIASWFSLTVDLVPRWEYSDALSWLNNLSTLEFCNIINDCETLCTLVISSIDVSFRAFKGQDWCTDYKLLFRPVMALIIEFISHGHYVKELYQWCKFLKKTPLSNPSLEEQALTKWLTIEEGLCAPIPPLKEREIYHFSRPFREKIDRTRFRPRHSGGRVAERGLETLFDKYMFSRPIKPLYGLSARRWSYPPVDRNIKHISRLTFVPKTAKALRAIAMEPAALMWYQQGWKDQLYDTIQAHSYGCIHFTDQRYNQRLCRWASAHGEYATIDFSSASDTVALSLIQGLLRDAHPSWQRVLLCGRSEYCEIPTGEILKLNKYAPMGSTFCFPIESLVFYSVASALLEEECGTHMPVAPELLVFGDDCIVPSTIAEPFMDRCRELGFIPNQEKSFTDGPFRESCGCDVYKGEVITPLYFRIPPGTPRDVERQQSIIAAANHAYLHGYKRLREYLLSLASRCIPFSSDIENANALYSPTPYTTKYRHNPDLQLNEYQSYLPLSWGSRHVGFDSDVALQEWLRIREYTPPEYMPDMHIVIPPTLSGTSQWISVD